MDTATIVAICVAVLLFIIIFRKIIKTSLRFIFKLLLNTVMGFIALFVINLLGGFIGISIGVNWITAIVVGIFGLPGVALLLLLQWLLM